jgi:hypothetical protein
MELKCWSRIWGGEGWFEVGGRWNLPRSRGVNLAIVASSKMHGFLLGCVLVGTSCTRSFSQPGGLSWNESSRQFAWPGGEVKIPHGFTHHAGAGDTFEGHFSSPDGNLTIRYDIGWYAGAYASRKDGSPFSERLIDGARVWTARRILPDGRGGSKTEVAVTFPDAGCANFFLDSSRAEDGELITGIAQTYRPGLYRRSDSSGPCQGLTANDAKK